MCLGGGKKEVLSISSILILDKSRKQENPNMVSFFYTLIYIYIFLALLCPVWEIQVTLPG